MKAATTGEAGRTAATKLTRDSGGAPATKVAVLAPLLIFCLASCHHPKTKSSKMDGILVRTSNQPKLARSGDLL